MLGFSGLSSQGAKQYFKAGLGSVKGSDDQPEHGQGNPQKGAELSVVFHSEGCCLPLPPHMAGAGEEPLAGVGPCAGALGAHRAPRLWDLPGISLPVSPDRDNDPPQGQ